MWLTKFPAYWRFRAAGSRLWFWIGARRFALSHSAAEYRLGTHLFLAIVRLTIPQLLFAILVAGFLYVGENKARILWDLGAWEPQQNVYIALLSSVAQIGGVFIGLYFAALTSVGSSFYAKEPNNIRALFVRERVGSAYMRFVAFVTFFSLVLLGAQSMGLRPLVGAIPVVLVLSGVAVIAFVRLGQRTLDLFDPTVLAGPVLADLEKWAKFASADGYRFTEPAFQAHASRQAEQSLSALELLASIGVREAHLNGRPYTELVEAIAGTFRRYLITKRRIPWSSRWYPSKYEFRNWYRTEDSAIEIAGQTGTHISPTSVNDHVWFETRLWRLLEDAIYAHSRAGRFDLLNELLAHAGDVFVALANEEDVKGAFAKLKQIADKLLDEIAAPVGEPLLNGVAVEHVGAMEQLALAPISILLAYSERSKNLGKSNLQESLERVDWTSKGIYQIDARPYLLERLEWLRDRIMFEIRVDGRLASPSWYQTELAAIVVAEQFKEAADVLIATLDDWYNELVDRLARTGHPWFAAAVLSRRWEYQTKLAHRIDEFENTWKSLTAVQRIDGLPWPSVDLQAWKDRIRRCRSNVLQRMSIIQVQLAAASRSDALPDYAGQFLHVLGEECLAALLEGDSEVTKQIVGSYFYGCLARFEELRPRDVTQNMNLEGELAVAAAPVIDLVDLSGYALLLSEFYEKAELFAPFRKVWERYLSKDVTPKPIQQIAALLNVSDIPFAIPHRGVLRTSWQLKVGAQLSSLPHEEMYVPGHISYEDIVIHESPLVREFASGEIGPHYDGVDIMIDRFFRTLPDGAEQDFGRSYKDLNRSIEMQEDLYARYKAQNARA